VAKCKCNYMHEGDTLDLCHATHAPRHDASRLSARLHLSTCVQVHKCHAAGHCLELAGNEDKRAVPLQPEPSLNSMTSLMIRKCTYKQIQTTNAHFSFLVNHVDNTSAWYHRERVA
jgi:hypothetical protein